MAGLDHRDDAGRAAVAVAGDRDADEPIFLDAAAIMAFCHLGHGAGGLAGGEDDEPARVRRLRQMRRQACRRMRRVYGGTEQLFKQLSLRLSHGSLRLAYGNATVASLFSL